MQCDICCRAVDARLQFNCTSCARNALYGPRIQQAQVLLEAEALGQDIEKNIASCGRQSEGSDEADEVSPTYAIELGCAERVTLEEKTATIMAQADLLRRQTEELKAYMDKRKAELSQRRSTLSSAIRSLSKRADSEFEPLRKGIERTAGHWDTLHAKTTEARNFLCREAAQLYGLQQRRRKKGAPGRDVYLIGGTPISDLRELNSESFENLKYINTYRTDRRFSKPCIYVYESSSTADPSCLTLPGSSSPGGDNSTSSRLSSIHHSLSWLILLVS